MKHSEQLDQLATALAMAQGQMEGALKASSNPYFKSRYADLKSVWEACRKPLSDNGLAVVQSVRCEHGNGAAAEVAALAEAVREKALPPAVIVTTLLTHSSGQWVTDELTMWPKDNTPQAIGSCVSYARRYSLAAMVGVYQADDDAETAQGRPEKMLEGEGVTGREALQYLAIVVKAISTDDAHGARESWDELDQQGQMDVWKLLTTKQKSVLRTLLQRIPSEHPTTETGFRAPEEHDNGEG